METKISVIGPLAANAALATANHCRALCNSECKLRGRGRRVALRAVNHSWQPHEADNLALADDAEYYMSKTTPPQHLI